MQHSLIRLEARCIEKHCPLSFIESSTCKSAYYDLQVSVWRNSINTDLLFIHETLASEQMPGIWFEGGQISVDSSKSLSAWRRSWQTTNHNDKQKVFLFVYFVLVCVFKLFIFLLINTTNVSMYITVYHNVLLFLTYQNKGVSFKMPFATKGH